jgi:hypothetical protein
VPRKRDQPKVILARLSAAKACSSDKPREPDGDLRVDPAQDARCLLFVRTI